MEWISVKDRLPSESMKVTVKCNDIVSEWEQDIDVYVCPEYGNAIWEDDCEDFIPVVTHWKPKT